MSLHNYLICIKAIKDTLNLSVNPKPYRLSLPLPRGNLSGFSLFEVLKELICETVVLDEAKDYKNNNTPRQFFISAEPVKAATEESIFRGKKGALFTLALVCAKVKARAARAEKTLMFLQCAIISGTEKNNLSF